MSLQEILENANEFTFARCDPNLALVAKVSVWSNVFGEGGSVAVDVRVPFTYKGEECTRAEHLLSENWEDRSEVPALRERLQSVADEWNEDAASHWRSLVESCREKVLAYEQRNLADTQAKLARIEAGDWS